MRWLWLALLIGCGGVECEQIAVTHVGEDPNRGFYFQLTCIHECGVMMELAYWIPGPSCEWERTACREYCAGLVQKQR